MNVFLRTETTSAKYLIGIRHVMSAAANTTGELFQSFMRVRNEIINHARSEVYCVQNYPEGYFLNFNPTAQFEKWAALEVNDFQHVPQGMETLLIPEGLYAVFLYQGRSSEAASFFQHIFSVWFPASAYEVDERPHFEILGDKYKNNSPDSEEEVWIPVKPRIA